MEVLRLTRHLDSETLHLPELRPFVGKDVEIIVREAESAPRASDSEAARHALRGSILRYDDPFEPAVPEEDWEVLR